jgi:hypothetical protein
MPTKGNCVRILPANDRIASRTRYVAICLLLVGLAACASSDLASSPGVAVASSAESIRPNLRGAGDADIFVWNGIPGQGTDSQGRPSTIVQFPSRVAGNVAPLRRYPLAAPAVYVGSKGNFWTGAINSNSGGTQPTSIQRLTSAGQLIERIPPVDGAFIGVGFDQKQNLYAVQGTPIQTVNGHCDSIGATLSEYQASSSWKVVSRRIELPGIYNISTCIVPVAIDRSGNVYIAESETPWAGTGVILEFSANSSGRAKPIRKFTSKSPAPGGSTIIASLAIDSKGDLFALVNGALLMYPTGTMTAQHILQNLTLTAFALDRDNHIYAVVQTAAPSGDLRGTYAVEEFAPNQANPLRVITGSRTDLDEPMGITVAQ